MNQIIIIYENKITINNVTQIKEFCEKYFIIKINEIPYQITGKNLILKDVSNNNKTLTIEGEIISILRKDMIKEKNKCFIKKLFS